MDISIFGFKLNLEVLILIGIVYLILVSHTLCGCSNYGLMEGLDTMKPGDSSTTMPTTPPTTMPTTPPTSMPTQTAPGGSTAPAPAGGMVAGKAKDGAAKANGKAGKEGFVGANTNYGQSSPYDLGSNQIINTSSWSKPDMTVIPGKPLSQGVKQFLAREPQPVPLQEGEMFMFATTPFKPECCPNTYSTSTGCACMTGKQYNYLIERGGNNVPYSEY
jgi:hypothetical protein